MEPESKTRSSCPATGNHQKRPKKKRRKSERPGINPTVKSANEKPPKLASIKVTKDKDKITKVKSIDELTDDTQQQHTQTSEILEEDDDDLKDNESKGPDYEEMTYIMGPFSTYGEWNVTMAKAKAHKQKAPDVALTTEKVNICDKGSSSPSHTPTHVRSRRKSCSSTKNGSTSDTIRVTIDLVGTVRAIPKDQMKPHKLRKDRQEFNPYRRVWVQAKLKQIGGHILDRESGKFVFVSADEFLQMDEQLPSSSGAIT